MYIFDSPQDADGQGYVTFELPVGNFFNAVDDLGYAVKRSSFTFAVDDYELVRPPRLINLETEEEHESRWCRFNHLVFEPDNAQQGACGVAERDESGEYLICGAEERWCESCIKIALSCNYLI